MALGRHFLVHNRRGLAVLVVKIDKSLLPSLKDKRSDCIDIQGNKLLLLSLKSRVLVTSVLKS